jgi:hypothetical protein
MRSVSSPGCRAIALELTVLLLAGCATTTMSPTSRPDPTSTFLEVTRTVERAL